MNVSRACLSAVCLVSLFACGASDPGPGADAALGDVAAPSDGVSTDTSGAEDATLVDADPVDADPVDADPVDADPVDADPVDAASDAASDAMNGDAMNGDAASDSDAASDGDAAHEDADAAPSDTAEPTVPLAGFGAISGACGVIDTELYDPAPSLFVNAIDFADDPYDPWDFELLTAWGQEVLTDGTAGGSSVLSEVFAMEVLARCELASLVATETEIVYDVQGKLTDLLVEIDGALVGVSVTRAVGFPFDAPYTVAQATTILERKLADILVSSANVSAEHRWVKQILHVVAYADEHTASIETAWQAIDAAVRADTIVIVTVTHGDDAFLY